MAEEILDKKTSELETLTLAEAIEANAVVPVAIPNVGNGNVALENLAGQDGAKGKSAYEIAVDNGFEGTEAQWLASLKGADGAAGAAGAKGDKGDKGDTGATGPQGPAGEVPTMGHLHLLRLVGDTQGDPAPYGYWVLDLEKPNANSTYGYDYATASELITALRDGEVFGLYTYSSAPGPDEDLFLMTYAQNQTSSGVAGVRIFFSCCGFSEPKRFAHTSIYCPHRSNGESDPTDERMAVLSWNGSVQPFNDGYFVLSDSYSQSDFQKELIRQVRKTVTNGAVNVDNNCVNVISGTVPAALTLNVETPNGNVNFDIAVNFAVEITPTVNCTVTIVINGSTTAKYSADAGNELTAGKTYQITCVGSCWTMAEFVAPAAAT